jgi:hypothetical protein
VIRASERWRHRLMDEVAARLAPAGESASARVPLPAH